MRDTTDSYKKYKNTDISRKNHFFLDRFYNKKKTLFFDLEEVLVSLSFDEQNPNFSFKADLKMKTTKSEVFLKEILLYFIFFCFLFRFFAKSDHIAVKS